MGSRLKGSRCVPAPPTHRNTYAIERTTEEENSYRCLERFDLEARDDESIRRGVLETMDRKEGQRRERRKCVWSVRSKRNGKEYHSSEKEKEEMGLNFKATSRNIRCLFSSFFFSPPSFSLPSIPVPSICLKDRPFCFLFSYPPRPSWPQDLMRAPFNQHVEKKEVKDFGRESSRCLATANRTSSILTNHD